MIVSSHLRGVLLVLGAAFFWSTGGLIARHIETNQWNVMFYRGLFAALTLLIFLLIRDGRKMWQLFRTMGFPGLMVALCFGTAASSFVAALQQTNVATILFLQSTSPFIAGILGWIWLKEKFTRARLASMVFALLGVGIMVSGSDHSSNILGIGLSLLIAFSFATATLIVRRYNTIRMTPATCLSALLVCTLGLAFGSPTEVGGSDLFFLFLFGSLQLGLGFILFTYGARLLPAGQTTLLSLLESILSPIWVWIWPNIHENPGSAAILGGLIVIAAVIISTILDSTKIRQITPLVQ